MAFDDAERLAVKCSDQEIQMRAFEASGRYHERRGQAEVAAEKYRMALKTAECLSVTSDEATDLEERLKWDLLRVENHKDQRFENFMRAEQPGDSFQQGRKAWQGFVAAKTNSDRPLAARGFGSVEDFRRRLDEARQSSADEDEDEDIRW